MSESFPALPDSVIPPLDQPYNILITGIGGSGVITIGALLGMAGHLEQKGVSVLDMTGVSQKNGAVTSHVRIAATPEAIRAQRIATAEADLILGCDMLTAGAPDAIAKTRPGRTVAVINTFEQPPGQFTQHPDWQFPAEKIRALIEEAVGNQAHFVDATTIATALMGDSIATNLFMLGNAHQRGLVPITEAAILRAIELNGVAVDANKQAFLWGRRAAVDLHKVEQIALAGRRVVAHMPQSLEKTIQRRVELLTAYQNKRYARQYESFLRRVQAAERRASAGEHLTQAVAHNLFKLMAYKDEYEVARLYTDGAFMQRLNDTFEGEFSLTFHLAPPLFAKRDTQGHLIKTTYGSWIWYGYKVLAGLRFLRGTAFDIFGRTHERRVERELIDDYREVLASALDRLSPDLLEPTIKFAQLPEQIRGFGHVKDAQIDRVRPRWRELAATMRGEKTAILEVDAA